MKKKFLAITMSIVLVTTGFSACSKEKANEGDQLTESTNITETANKETNDQISFPLKEKEQFTSFSIMSNGHSLQDCLAMQTAMESTNISIEFNSVLGSDLKEKRNLILNSGNYPDMFFKASLSMNDLDKYGSQGIFIPLEELIRKYAPNLTKELDKRNAWEIITNSDGHIYSLPNFERPYGAMTAYWINKKWLDRLSLSVPTSFDELYTVLKAFKEKDANGNGDPNDEIPMTATDGVPPQLILAYEDYCYDQGTKCAVIDNKLTYIPADSKFKHYISFITKLYQEGLLDKNAFTQKHEQQAAIGQSGDVLGSFFAAGAFLTVGRDNDDDYIILPPFYEGCYPMGTGVIPGAMSITDSCKKPEILIAWADQFYDENGGILAWLGVEGKTYKVNDDGTWSWFVNNGYGDDISTIRSTNTIQGSAFHPSIQPDFWYDKMSPKADPEAVYNNKQREIVGKSGKVPLPVLKYSEEDTQQIATIKTDIDSYISEYVAQVATGKENLEESWDSYQKTLKAMGVDKLIHIYEKAYEEAISR